MMNQFLRSILLVSVLYFHAAICKGQIDSLPPNYRLYTFTPTQLLGGEVAFSYEWIKFKKPGIEVGASYVFGDYYVKDAGTADFTFASATGVAFRFSPKFYLSERKPFGFYLAPQLTYKFVHQPRIQKEYLQYADISPNFSRREVPYEEKVCDECRTKETRNKNVFALHLIVGYNKKLSEKWLLTFFAGTGVKWKMFDVQIHELYDKNIDYLFRFENYHFKYYELLPSFTGGVKLTMRNEQ